jgi:dihydroorotate dehydrogenase (NAD+) catalytic subunit
MGGVSNGRDALEFIAAGAAHVALGTVLFADPDAPARIRAELAVEAAALGFADPPAAHAVSHLAAVVNPDDRTRAKVASI